MNHPATQNRNSSFFQLPAPQAEPVLSAPMAQPRHSAGISCEVGIHSGMATRRWDEPIKFWASDPTAVLQYNDMGDDAFLAGQAN